MGPPLPPYSPSNPFAPKSGQAGTGAPSTPFSPNNPFAQPEQRTNSTIPILSDSDVKDLIARGADTRDVERILMIQRRGVSPQDAEAERLDVKTFQDHPILGSLPRPVRDLMVGYRRGLENTAQGITSFIGKFFDHTAGLTPEKLRYDYEHWDELNQTPFVESTHGPIGYSDYNYGNRENLQKLIHQSIIARNQGREVTNSDIAMVVIPPYAVGSMVYGGASRILDAPAELAGPGNSSTRIQNFATALTEGGISIGMAYGGAAAATHTVAKYYGIADRALNRSEAAIANNITNTLRDNVIGQSNKEINASVRDFANQTSALDTWQYTLNRISGIENPELVGIKNRLIGEERGAIVSTMANVQRNLRPEDITIIPGVERVPLVMDQLKRSGISDDNIALHRRLDGSGYDVAMYGKDSPLAIEPDYRKQFEREGWFFGQEASYKGRPVSYEGLAKGRSESGRQLVSIRDLSSGEVLQVPDGDLRRPPYTRSSSVKTEVTVGHEPRDPFDVLAEAQRGAPEEAMLAIQKAQISQLYGFAAEKIGDIVNRMAQGFGKKGLFDWSYSETLGKVNEAIRTLEHKYGFAREVSEQIVSNRKFYNEPANIGRNPNFGPNADTATIFHGLAADYAEAHENLPVFNRAQQMARNAASNFGRQKFEAALDNLKELQAALLQGKDNWKEFAGEVHKPARVRTFRTDELFDDYYKMISGEDPYKGGAAVLGSYIPSLNEIIMRPAEALSRITSGGRSYESVLSHEVAHAFGNRVIQYNRPYAERILQWAREGRADLVNQGTIDYIQKLDAMKAEGREIYMAPDAILKEAITEELSHRYPVTPLKEMFQLYQTELKRASLNDVYTDFKSYRASIMDTPHNWESPFDGSLRFPDMTNLERGPLGNSIRYAKRYFTKDEFMAEFARDVSENKLDDLVTPEIAQQIAHYADTRERFSLLQSFDRQLEHFAQLRGIQRVDLEGFKNFIGQRYARELRETYLTPDELDNFNKIQDRLQLELGRDVSSLETVSAMDQLPLAMEAASNGYKVQHELNGDISLNKTNEIVPRPLRFRTTESAREFLNQSGQQVTPKLNVDTNIPEQVGGAAMPPSGAKPPNSYGPNDGLQAEFDHTDANAFDRGFLGKLLDTGRAMMDHFVGREAGFESVDNLHGSKIATIQRSLERAKGLADGHASTFAHANLDPIGKMMKGLKKEQFLNVFRYNEAMSSSELMSEMLGEGRSEAVDIAKGLADLRTDTSRAIEFSRKIDAIKDDLKGHPQDEINLEIQKLMQALKMDQNGVIAAGIFSGLRTRDINIVPIDEIGRLADALMWDAPSRDQFAKLANMSPKELLIAKRFEAMYDKLFAEAGLPPYRKISGYMAHMRAQIGRDLPSPEASVLFQKGLGSSMLHTFINEFVRTGELSAIDLNPYTAAIRYINSMYMARDFVPVYTKALKDFDVELSNLSQSATGKNIVNSMKERVQRYMSDLRGFPSPAANQLRAGIEQINNQLGTKIPTDVVESLNRTYMSIMSTALIAFRPYIGLRHLAQFELFAGARFGFNAMHEGLRLAEKPGAIDALKNSGVLAGLDYMALVTPEEAATSLLVKHGGNAWRAYEAFAKVGHAVTLLPTIYEHTYTAVYLGMEKLASDNLSKLASNKLSKQAAYDNLALDSFAPSFRLEFDTLVRGGKLAEAASLIGKRAAKETIFDYQRANAPRGWNSPQGRFLTMFGTWSLHATELVNNMITRGSLRHRVNYMARFAMAQGALWLAGRSIGLDLLGSTVAHSYFWHGSPQFQLLQTTLTALNGSGVEQKLAEDRLFKLVPGLKITREFGERRFSFDFNPLTADPRSLFVPGSYAAGDWMQAIQEAKDPWGRYTLPQIAGRAIGVPTVKHKSWIDDYLERLGLHAYNYNTTVPQQ